MNRRLQQDEDPLKETIIFCRSSVADVLEGLKETIIFCRSSVADVLEGLADVDQLENVVG
jgi:hypothetical protein